MRLTSAPDARFHKPWGPLVWGLAVSQWIGWGTLYFAPALFVAPMEADLGWSRADINGAIAAGLLAAGLSSIPVGAILDRWGGHAPMTAGAVAGAALLVAWSRIDNLTVFYGVWIAIGMAMAASLQDVPFAIVAANVKDYRRAIMYLTLLGGLSSTTFWPLARVLIEAFGWRDALLVLAAIQLCVPATLNFLLLRGTRGSRSGEALASSGAPRSPLRSALARPAFWGLAICFAAQSYMFTGMSYHAIPLFTERGLDLDAAVLALAVLGPAQMSGRFVLFLFGEATSTRVVGRAMVLVLPVAAALLFLAPSFGLAGAIVAVAVFGIGNGIMTIVRAAGIVDILGARGYGVITGAMNMVLMIPRTSAPILMAAVWQATGGYDAVIWSLVAATTVGAASFWLASLQRR